ncbi:MAG: hypothetical protein ACRCX2_27645 [Paraclostridium sp.]
MALGLNFFFAIFSILIKPWFNMDPNLGVTKYGIITAFESVGIIIASLILTKVNIRFENKSKVMLSSLLLQSVFFFLGVLSNNFYIMCVCFFMGCFFNTVSNTVSISSMMLVIP